MDFRPSPHQNGQPAAAPVAAPAAHHAVGSHTQPKGDDMLKKQKQLIVWLIVALIVVAAVGAAAFFMHKYNESQKQVNKLASNPTLTAQQQQADLIAKVGKLTVLPSGETPTIATVTDITKLAGQAFFSNAKNGDKVLIYTQAKEAYLYRPSTNKLINIAPVNIGSDQTTGTTSSTAQPTTSSNKKTP